MDAILEESRGQAGALIPILQKTQGLFGYLPQEVLRHIASSLRMPLADIYGVATFYAQFSLVPKGQKTVGVCMGTACYVRGADKALEKCKECLGIDVGGTSADGKFSLEVTRCVGACGLAPVVTVGSSVYGGVTPEQVPGILAKEGEL